MLLVVLVVSTLTLQAALTKSTSSYIPFGIIDSSIKNATSSINVGTRTSYYQKKFKIVKIRPGEKKFYA